ncbi:MAG: iron-sulfur cluster assembly scaffold protein [Acidobacteria bacterium]|nr:iron-sulfur cluster assembly scaffold protein [Acidobacteriota bacterium]
MLSPQLIDHFENPRNAGDLGAGAVVVEVSNPVCGDILRIAARLSDGRVAEVRFKTRGCTASIAAGSALTVWLTGKGAAEIAGLDPAVIDEALGGLAAESKHVALLCRDAARALARAIRHPGV